MKIRVCELFAGVGGFRLGIEQALGKDNVDFVYVNDIDKYCKKVYDHNHCKSSEGDQNGGSKTGSKSESEDGERLESTERESINISQRQPEQHSDGGAREGTLTYDIKKGGVDGRSITEVGADEIPEHDLLVGGFPCQSFSIAGKRLGFEDTRGTLFFEIARIIKKRNPKYILLENVKGLISHDGGETLRIILETLGELGYYVNIEVFNSKDFGVPQNRERIFFVCRNIKTLLEDGQNEISNTSKVIIQEFLFQILLGNLKEVRELQEVNSKDSIVGYLLWKEISQRLKLLDENIKDGTSIAMEERSFLLKENPWQNIDTWLKKNLGGDFSAKSKSTISIAIRQIIESKTYTYLEMLKAILLVIVHLRKSSKSLWEEVLLSLIVFQKNTKYERVNVEKEKVIITESGDAHIGEGFRAVRERIFIVGHLRGEPRPEVFPFGESNSEGDEPLGLQGVRQVAGSLWATDYKGTHNNIRELALSLDASYYKGIDNHGQRTAIIGTLRTHKDGEGFREMKSGLSPTIPAIAREDGSGQPVIKDGFRIRRLTPLECQRLQGFPDDYYKGLDISDTQKYKQMGNAVTVPVIKEIIKRLYKV